MKNPISLVTLTKKLCLALFVLALPQLVRADEVPATVTSLQGNVTVTDASGNPVTITQGSKVPVGDTVKTGADGTVGLTLVPGAGTVVTPNSEVRISSLNFNKGADGSNNRNIKLKLKNGSLISTLFKKDGHSDFQVTTPYGVAAAKGTSWAVTIDGTSLTVDVANGVVNVVNAAGKQIASIPAGQGFDSKTGTVKDLPQSVIDGILATLNKFLPDLTKAQLINALNNATINPATVNSKDDINSPNK